MSSTVFANAIVLLALFTFGCFAKTALELRSEHEKAKVLAETLERQYLVRMATDELFRSKRNGPAVEVTPDVTAFPTAPATGNAQDPSDCVLPCKLQNGCVCDGLSHKNAPDGQIYGRCSSCSPGWGGWDCSTIVTTCKNGGTMVISKNQTVHCNCSRGWHGPSCEERFCLYSRGSNGTVVQQRPNATNQFCDNCAPGYEGVQCQICTDGTTCPNGNKCNASLVANGHYQNFNCDVTSPALIALLGEGRAVKGTIEMKCNKPSGFNSSSSDGECFFSLWRTEPNNSYVDPFFFVALQNCSMSIQEQMIPAVMSTVPPVANTVRIALSAAIYACLFVLLMFAVLGKFFNKINQLRDLLLYPICLLLVVTLAVFILFSAFFGHKELHAPHQERTVRYSCLSSSASCAPRPPVRSWWPHCPNSIIGNNIIPILRGASHVTCDMAHNNCTYIHEDIKFMPIPMTCQASSCDGAPPIHLPSGDGANRKSINRLLSKIPTGLILALIVFIIFMIAAIHWLVSFRIARERKREFYRLYRRPADELDTSRQTADNHVNAHREASVSTTTLCISEASYSVPLASPMMFKFFAQFYLGKTAATKLRKTEELDTEDSEKHVEERRSVRNGSFTSNSGPSQNRLQTAATILRGETEYKQILNDISFTVKSGEALAILGPSGAGKTTLLDLLAKHEKDGIVTGCITLNFQPLTGENLSSYKRVIGFVSQEDFLIPALTVRQSIRHAARLKLPAAFDSETIDQLVGDTIEALGLSECADTAVGGSGIRGISGGERRRTSIGCELIGNPRILFLDEPTSGLDSVCALKVMRVVVGLAKSAPSNSFQKFFAFRPIVIFSIHQPSTDIYHLFDKVLLLTKGNVVYYGPAGQAVDHMRTVLGLRADDGFFNPAESILQMADEAGPDGHEALRLHPTPRDSQMEEASPRAPADVLESARKDLKYYPNFWQQFALLARRTADALMGSYYLIASHAGAALFLGLVLSFLYPKEKLDLSGTEDKAGMITFLLLVVAFSSLSCLDLFIAERKLFAIERENRYYGPIPYFTAKVLYDFIPLRIVPTAIVASVIYFPMGLREDTGSHFMWFVVIFVTFAVNICAICLCVGMVAPSFGSGALFSALIILWNSAFGGLMIQSETIPPFFRPFKYFSPFYFAFESLMINELDGLHCIFDPSNSEGAKAGVRVPVLCSQFLANLGLKPDNFKRDVAALFIWVIFFLLLAMVLLAFAVRHKR